MSDLIRDASIGQVIRFLSRGRYLKYPEEKEGFELPDAWIQMVHDLESPSAKIAPDATTASESGSTVLNGEGKQPQRSATDDEKPSPPPRDSMEDIQIEQAHNDEENNNMAIQRTKSIPIVPRRTKDGAILVDWYYTDDPENPHNWTIKKRLVTTLIICLYTFVVYTTSAIYVPSTEGIMKQFGVSSIVATLGLSLYVLGYGVGPLLFSP
uniref:Major facilitator superfamily (MFS) profile domain-containing protein n=1 Tax=Bionectria ochroleuca TaxID=29856 RepID=A0A8H7TNW8_BIOOC